MPLIILTVALTGLVLALSSLDAALLRAVAAAAGAAMMLGAALAPAARRALADIAGQHWLAGLAFAAFLALLARQGGFFSGPDALARGHELAAVLGVSLAAPAAAAVAKAYGRSLLTAALLGASIPVAFAALLTHGMALEGPLGRAAPRLDAPGLLAGFALTIVLAAHLAADELRRRPSAGEPALAPLARRLFAPTAGIVTSLAMLLLAGAAETLGAAAAGALVFAGALWPRARRSRVGGAIVPALAMVSVGTGALALLSAALADGARASPLAPGFRTGLDVLLVQAGGLAGALLSVAPLAAILLVLVVSKDRGRRPSRGAPLLIASASCAALVSLYAPGLAAPPAALLFAVITGLAASYLDSAERKSDPS